MKDKDFDAKIGEAWQAHYDGQHDVAIDKFKKLVAEVPDHIDANWGLGLSYRRVGDKDNALEAFKKVQKLVAAKLDAEPEDYERLFMLNRMISQQIDQYNQFIV